MKVEKEEEEEKARGGRIGERKGEERHLTIGRGKKKEKKG